MAKKIVEPKPNTEADPRLQKIGDKIKKLRIAAGYSSQETFAWDNKFSRLQYWKMESGNNMTLTTLFRILDIHGLTLEEFFKDIK